MNESLNTMIYSATLKNWMLIALCNVSIGLMAQGVPWNYEGYIHTYPIKAWIEYGEAEFSGAGGYYVPISGYYYYPRHEKKIYFTGECSGSGYISLSTRSNGKDEREYFDGEFTNSMLEDFEGTWQQGNKTLSFELSPIDD